MVFVVKTHRETGEEIRGEWTTPMAFWRIFEVRMRGDELFPVGHAARHYSETRGGFKETLEGEVAYLNSIDPNWTYRLSYIWLPGYVSD